ncbi:putative membrane protein [Clostridioides difficile CD160]|nr:putative membrane protein [Clostridioides difficile CD160]
MSISVGTINLGLNINQGTFNKQLSGIANGAKSTIGSAFGGLGKMMGVALGATAIAAFGKSCIDLGSDLNEVQNVVDVTFGSMAQDINDFAKTSITQMGMSETAAKRYTGTMGAMLKSSGLSTKQAADMSKTITQLSADMSSFYNLDSEEAFEKIRSGISGEIEPLRQLGINMSVANLEAYAMSKGITKAYQDMSQSEQTLLRYNYLLSVTKDAQGDFVRTQGAWANQTRILSEQFNALKTTLGQALINMLTPVVKMLNTLILKLQVVAQQFKAFTESVFGDNASSGGFGSIPKDIESIGNNSDSASDSIAGIGDASKDTAKKIKGLISGFDEINTLTKNSDTDGLGDMGNVTSPISPNIDTGNLSKVNQELNKMLADMFKPFQDAWSKEGQATIDSMKYAFTSIKDVIKSIGSSFKEVWTNGTGTEILTTTLQILQNIFNVIGDINNAFIIAWESNNLGTQLIQSISDALLNVLRIIRDIGNSFIEVWNNGTGIEFCTNILNLLKTIFDIIGSIAGAFDIAWKSNETGTILIQTIFDMLNSILELINNIGQTFVEVWNNGTGVEINTLILQILTDIFGTINEITDAFSIAWESNNIGKQIIQGICDIITNLLTLLHNMQESCREAWEVVGVPLATTFYEILNAIIGVIENLTGKLVEVWDNGGEHLYLGIVKLAEKIFELVGYVITDFIAPFANGLIDILAPAISFVLDVLGTLADYLTNFIDWLLNEGKPVLDTIIIVLGSMAVAFGVVKTACTVFDTVKKGIDIFNGLKNTISAAGGVMKLIPQVLGTMLGPFGLVVIAVGALIAVGVLLYKNWDTIKKKATEIFGYIKNFISGVCSKIGGFFSSMGTKIKSVIDAIPGVFRKAFNGLVNIVKAPLNGVIKLFNSSLGSLKFDIPDWVPGFGGNSFGIPKIPLLAKGGIIEQPTLSMVGERGTEAVVPLENNTQGLDLLANKIMERMNGLGKNNNTSGDLTVELKMDGNKMGEVVIKAFRQMERKTGKTILEL